MGHLLEIFCQSKSYAGKTSRCYPRYDFPPDWDITHSPKRWSNEATTIQYIQNIIIPYVNKTRETYEDDTPALIIMDNFKGQITSTVSNLLEENNIHVCLLPANTTDRLQPIDLTVNKPTKDFLKRCFGDWYAEQIQRQLEENDIESTALQPINLGLPMMKELGAKWMVEMAQYFADNPQIIVNGFIKAGIIGALGSHMDIQDEPENDSTNDIDSEDNESDQDDTGDEVDLQMVD